MNSICTFRKNSFPDVLILEVVCSKTEIVINERGANVLGNVGVKHIFELISSVNRFSQAVL